MWVRLRSIFIFLFAFIVLLAPSLIAAVYSYRQIESELTTQIYNERQALAKQSARVVESRLDSMRNVGLTAARDIADQVEKEDWEGAVNEISYISDEFPFVDRIFLSDLQGHTTAYFPPSPENVNKDFSFRDWYKGVSAHWQPYASEVFKRAPQPQYNTVAMMAPIKKADGTPLGAVGLAINLNSFFELSNNFQIDKGGFLYIVNQKGQIVAHPKYDAQGPIVDYTSVPVVQHLLNGETGVGINYNPVEKEDRLAAYEVVPGYHWGVVVTDPVTTAFAERDAALRTLRYVYALIVGLSAIFAFVILLSVRRLQSSQKQLQLSAAKDEAILESAGDGLVAADTNGVIQLVNTVALNMWGVHSRTELIGRSIFDAIAVVDDAGEPLPLNKRPFEVVLRGGKPLQGTYRYKRKDGSTFPATLSVSPIRLEGKVIGCVGVFRDTTREHEIDRMKSEFISIASHQLKTPLTAMRWFSELLLGSFAGKLSKEQKEYADAIHTSNLHMIELVNTLLNISRIESGRMIIEPVETDVVELAREVIDSVEKLYEQKKQKMTVKIDDALPKMKVDPKLLRQVYQNLLTNACKYTPDGGSISVTLEKEKDVLLTTVRDTGAGIPQEDTGKVFGKFYRGENILKSGNEGTGLGLYLVKTILESAGCKIWFESTVGKGTSFFFTIPLAGMKGHKGEVELS